MVPALIFTSDRRKAGLQPVKRTPFAALGLILLLATAGCRGGPIGRIEASPITTPQTTLSIVGLGQQNQITTTVSENGYTGVFTLSGCSANATTTASSTVDGNSTLTIVGVTPGSCTLTVEDSNGQTEKINLSVAPAPLTLSSSTLSLAGVGAANASSVTIAEANYTGAFAVSGCAFGVNPTSESASSGSATISVSNSQSGPCTVTVVDSYGQTKALSVNVAPSPIVLSSVNVALPGLGGSNAGSLSVSELGYVGAFTVSGCSGVATVSTSTPSAGSALLSVVGIAAGTCTLTVRDSFNQTATANVSVNVTTIGGS